MLLECERLDVLKYCRLLQSRKLVKGTGGNISIINCESKLVAISPSSVEYSEMRVEDIAVVDLNGNQIEGNFGPSSEMHMHLECFKAREDIHAVVHTHSTYATVLACMNRGLPGFYYLQAYAGGDTKCIPYYTFGTQELARVAAAAINDRNALLLGGHGLLSVGRDAASAFNVAEVTETAAELYVHILKIGEPMLFSEAQMQAAIGQLVNYKKKEVCKTDENC